MSSAEVPDFVTVDDYLAAEELAFGKSEYVDGWGEGDEWGDDSSQLRENELFG